jgi:hypothetical protein
MFSSSFLLTLPSLFVYKSTTHPVQYGAEEHKIDVLELQVLWRWASHLIKNDNHYIKLFSAYIMAEAGIAQGWTTEESEFEFRQGQELSLLHVVQTGIGAKQVSYPMGTGGCFSGDNAAGA